MGCASRKTLANFWKGLRVVVLAAVEAAVVVAVVDAIFGKAVVVAVGLRARDLHDWLVQVVHFF
jgi:hypothetical protein